MIHATDQTSEIRLIIHCYPKHTTAALVTRDRRGSENWDRRHHAWDLPLPQRDYESFSTEEQLWVILGSLASHRKVPRPPVRAKPPEPPDGGYRGEQATLPGLERALDTPRTLKSGPSPSERSGA